MKQQPSLGTKVPKPSRSRVVGTGRTNPESGSLEVIVSEVIPIYTPCFLDSGLMNSNTGKIVQYNVCYGLNVCVSPPPANSYIEILMINVMVLEGQCDGIIMSLGGFLVMRAEPS